MAVRSCCLVYNREARKALSSAMVLFASPVCALVLVSTLKLHRCRFRFFHPPTQRSCLCLPGSAERDRAFVLEQYSTCNCRFASPTASQKTNLATDPHGRRQYFFMAIALYTFIQNRLQDLLTVGSLGKSREDKIVRLSLA